MRIIAFRIWGDYAHFRRFYTTSSPLTFSLSPPSAVRGLIGAILGLSREEYPETLSHEVSRIGVRLLRPVRKIRLALNYIDTKDGAWIRKPSRGRLHTQVRVEFIKNPDYEIYFHHDDSKLMDKLTEVLRDCRSVFTPYLGITECLANFKFLWDLDIQPISGKADILSAFRKNELLALHLKEGTGILIERMPVDVSSDRVLRESDDIVFNPYAGSIPAEHRESWQHPQECPGTAITLVG